MLPLQGSGNLAGKGWEECESWRKLCAVPACQVVFQLGLLPVNSPSSRVRRGRRPLHTARCVQSCFKLHKAWGEVCAYVCVGESMCIYKRTCACVCTRMWRPEDNPRYWFFFFLSGAILSFGQGEDSLSPAWSSLRSLGELAK